MQEGGADIIELGVPFSDPMADGPAIQETNLVSISSKLHSLMVNNLAWQVALQNNVEYAQCLGIVRQARTKGLTVPVLLMGTSRSSISLHGDVPAHQVRLYRLLQSPSCIWRGESNPRRKRSRRQWLHCSRSSARGSRGVPGEVHKGKVRGFSVHTFQCILRSSISVSYIPLIAPSTTDHRIEFLASIADTFLYVVSKVNKTPLYLRRVLTRRTHRWALQDPPYPAR